MSDFLADRAGKSRSRMAAHLERCPKCRYTLQLLHNVSEAAANIPGAGPSVDLYSRILASRADSTRIILPIADARKRAGHGWLVPVAAGLLLTLLGGALISRRAPQLEAGTTAGTLTFMPELPRPGQSVAVTYRPSGMLSGQPWVTLRARERSANDESYNGGIPITTAAILRRDASGDFTGNFVLPDTAVYAAFAVEDSSAGTIDDNDGRNWEVLTSDTARNPSFESLNQRANDMMGRNWQEGYATAVRMVQLYPNDLRAQIWMKSFDSWLGRDRDDSVLTARRAVLAAFDSTLRSRSTLANDDMGRMAWFAQRIDSSTAVRWQARLLHDAPDNSFAIQWRLFDILNRLYTRHDTTQALRQMDALWSEAPADRKPQVVSYAIDVALQTTDTSLVKLWAARTMLGARNHASAERSLAAQFASMPAFRAEGIRRLQSAIEALTRLSPSERSLNETLAQQRDRDATTRRRMLASLGQALVATGDHAGARAALAEAASRGWNVNVFRAVRTASLTAGDTAHALTMAAWISADPRTPSAFADSVRLRGERVLGTIGWQRQLDSARGEFARRMLADARARTVDGRARVSDRSGTAHTIQELAGGKVTVVAFWSRFCGPAIEDLPRLNTVAARLARDGVHVVSIVDETAESKELASFLKEKNVTVPTYLDTWHESSRVFNQWGTPSYYVLDSNGRIRFDASDSADEALAQAEALRLSGE